jgi:putative addiction module component (TIGR02574 family)
MNAALSAEINRLTPVEKLQLVEELWDALATNPDQLPIPAWHAQALDEAHAAYEANPDAGSPWPEVKGRITRKT